MAELKLEMNGAKLELNGTEAYIQAESTRFYHTLGLGCMATQSFSAGDCTLSRTERVSARWEEIISNIKRGQWNPNIGDMVSCKLKDKREIDFVVTDINDDAVRFESRDCLGEKVRYTELEKYCKRTFTLLPDALQAAIMPTERKWLDKEGNLKTGTYKLFVPSCAEIVPEDECIGDKGVYKQLEWYKDRRHRIRFDKKDGDSCWYWTLSAYSGYSAYFVSVGDNGNVSFGSASSAFGAPICFQIPKS